MYLLYPIRHRRLPLDPPAGLCDALPINGPVQLRRRARVGLYDDAHANLDDTQRAGLVSAVDAMPDAAAVQANLEAEAHFVEPPGGGGTHERYEEFLRTLAGARTKMEFEQTCRNFHLRGVRTSAADGKALLHYCTLNDKLKEWIGNVLLFAEGQYDPDDSIKGLLHYDALTKRGGESPSSLADRIAAIWPSLPQGLRAVMPFKRKNSRVFATFDDGTIIPP